MEQLNIEYTKRLAKKEEMRKEMTLQVPIAEIYLESIFLSNQKFTD
jgi:hypothetical protein